MAEDFVILVAEKVSGKSKGPNGYSRFKPVPYAQAGNVHLILYAMVYSVTHEGVLSVSKQITQEFNRIQNEMNSILAVMTTGGTYVQGYMIVLWDLNEMATGVAKSNWSGIIVKKGGYVDLKLDNGPTMFNVDLSNKVLEDWGVI